MMNKKKIYIGFYNTKQHKKDIDLAFKKKKKKKKKKRTIMR